MLRSLTTFARFALTVNLLLPLTGFAQQAVNDSVLSKLVKQQSAYHQRMPIEKLYIQTDRANYAVGDTIWLKGYLFDADYLKYASRSGLVYLELAGDSNEVVYRRMLTAGYGNMMGQIAIDARDVSPGNYTLRAYTNWMRNFNEEYVFTKRLYITSAKRQPWQVNVKNNATITSGKETIQSELQFADAGKPLRLNNMMLRVMDGSRTLSRGDAMTDINGSVAVNFNLPSDTKNINLQAEDKKDGYKQTIPIILNRPEHTDLQFMPEGGYMVSGIPTKVGFKAIGEDGRGVNIAGVIVNSNGATITKLEAVHKGMGSFTILPKAGESYKAKITINGNAVSKVYPLPPVKSTGTVMNLQLTADSINVRLTEMAAGNTSNTYYLIAQSRGVICYAEPVKPESYTKEIKVAQSQFPTGIARFSLLNNLGEPLNERLVYINHNDNLKINITPNKSTYAKRDSIALNIEVKDKDGKPVQGSFSLAVTDDTQVVSDSLAGNLTSALLLTSDLKGTVEDPGYYLQNNTQNNQALNNLLLTQGWVGYDWAAVNHNVKPTFDAEPEFRVQGKVTNLLGKAVAGAKVMLYGKNQPVLFADADTAGRFTFDELPVTDTIDYLIKATNSKGKSMGVGIEIDQSPPPPVWQKGPLRHLPWYVNSNPSISKPENSPSVTNLQEQSITGTNVLKQVEIRERKIIKGSKSLNQPGDADQILDEHEIEKSGAKTLLELLEQKVKGFYTGTLFSTGHPPMALRTAFLFPGNRDVYIVIDGVIILSRDFRIVKSYLEACPASDVVGVEVMHSTINMENYMSRYFYYDYKISAPIPKAFIEITTRSGVGPFRQVNAGSTSYKPLYQFNNARRFYRPRYITQAYNGVNDLRITLHWEPLVITDWQGKATVSFFASDRPGNYSVIMEGSDMNGKIGSAMQKLK